MENRKSNHGNFSKKDILVLGYSTGLMQIFALALVYFVVI